MKLFSNTTGISSASPNPEQVCPNVVKAYTPRSHNSNLDGLNQNNNNNERIICEKPSSPMQEINGHISMQAKFSPKHTPIRFRIKVKVHICWTLGWSSLIKASEDTDRSLFIHLGIAGSISTRNLTFELQRKPLTKQVPLSSVLLSTSSVSIRRQTDGIYVQYGSNGDAKQVVSKVSFQTYPIGMRYYVKISPYWTQIWYKPTSKSDAMSAVSLMLASNCSLAIKKWSGWNFPDKDTRIIYRKSPFKWMRGLNPH